MAIRQITAVDDLGGGSFVIHVDSPFVDNSLVPGSHVWSVLGDILTLMYPDWLSDPQTLTVTLSFAGVPSPPGMYPLTINGQNFGFGSILELIAPVGWTQNSPFQIEKAFAGPGGSVTFDMIFSPSAWIGEGLGNPLFFTANWGGVNASFSGISVSTDDGQVLALPDSGPGYGDQTLGRFVLSFCTCPVWVEKLAYDGPPAIGLPRALCHVGRERICLGPPLDQIPVSIAGDVDSYFAGFKPRPRRWNVAFRVSEDQVLLPSSLYWFNSTF